MACVKWRLIVGPQWRVWEEGSGLTLSALASVSTQGGPEYPISKALLDLVVTSKPLGFPLPEPRGWRRGAPMENLRNLWTRLSGGIVWGGTVGQDRGEGL